MTILRTVARLALLGAVLGAAGAHAAAGPDLLVREIARVRSASAATVPSDSQEVIAVRLGRAAAAVESGRTLLAMYELQPAWEMEAAWAFAASSGVKTDAQFAEKWKATGEPHPASPGARAALLFAEALAQSSEGKAVATYRASLPYSQDAGLPAGLYYLGESQAFGKFAALCRSLALPAPAGALPLRSLDRELASLETEILNAYDKAEGPARQPFIVIGVTLKLARQLDQQERRPGALLQYLLTRYRFALARPSSSSLVDPKGRLAAARTFGRDTDHSIAEFFLQLAEANVAAGGEPGPRAAAVVLDDVLPAYQAAVR